MTGYLIYANYSTILRIDKPSECLNPISVHLVPRHSQTDANIGFKFRRNVKISTVVKGPRKTKAFVRFFELVTELNKM